ncbi:MAG: hypothetical protein LQ344_004036 [Seirophora lacunosa]|nr:MAG: hypothetical protein LQ344_004036 [Seirophora lacunosa]
MFPQRRKDSRSGLQRSIELKNLNRIRSYGTRPSEDLEAHALPPQRRVGPQGRAQARITRNRIGFCALVMFTCLVYFLWFRVSTGQDTPGAESPSVSPPHLSGASSVYLWLVEHDGDAHDQSLATMKTLYAADIYATNTTDGCESIGERSTWNLDRAGYAEFYLDDIVADPVKYRRVLEADMVYCPRAGFDSSAYARSVPCRVYGNSYSSRDASWQHSPETRLLDVTNDLSLAHRPSFKGVHRVRPCICKAGGNPDGTVSSKALKSARRLVVECLGHLSARATDGFHAAHAEAVRTAPLGAVLVPGFYMLPSRAPGPFDTTGHGEPAHQADINTSDVLESALGLPKGRSAKVERGEPSTHDAAGNSIQPLQALPPATIVATDTEIVANASKRSLKSVYAALAAVVSLFLLAGTGHWMKRKRAVAEKRMVQSQRQSNKPNQSNDRIKPEGPEDGSGAHVSHDLQSRVRSFFSKNWWKKLLSLPSTRKKETGPELNDVERGDNHIKLQKKRGTRLGDSGDPGVPIMPPAAGATPSGRPASKTASTEGMLRVGSENVGPAMVEGSTTARPQGARGAAARRSHRSSSMLAETA